MARCSKVLKVCVPYNAWECLGRGRNQLHGVTSGFSYSASSMCYDKSYQQMRLSCDISLFTPHFPTCFGLLPAHHQGYPHLLLMCYHLVHVVLCFLSACVYVCVDEPGRKRRRTRTNNVALHEPSGST